MKKCLCVSVPVRGFLILSGTTQSLSTMKKETFQSPLGDYLYCQKLGPNAICVLAASFQSPLGDFLYCQKPSWKYVLQKRVRFSPH